MQTFANPLLLGACLFTIAVLPCDRLLAQPVANADPSSDAGLADQIQQLGVSSYRARQRASRRIVAAGDAALEPLRLGLDSRDAEIRLQCRRLIIEINEQQTQRELHLLMSFYDPNRTYRLPGWQPFAASCGDDPSARGLFQRLLRRNTSFMVWLQHVHDDPSYDIENQLEDQQRYLSPDVQQLNSGDLLTWSMLLLAATNPKICQVPVLGSHIRCGLQCGPTIHNLTHGSNSTATLRLVRSWLRRQSTAAASRSTLRIAMLYRCDQLAGQLAQGTLDNKHSSPSAVQTALFFVAAQQPQIARAHLHEALQDQRVCQVWQIASQRRRAIQTQVRDTALALMLHLNGVDPRTVGFRDLQADPLTIYGEQTLGFETEEQRNTAHRLGQQMLLSTVETQTTASRRSDHSSSE